MTRSSAKKTRRALVVVMLAAVLVTAILWVYPVILESWYLSALRTAKQTEKIEIVAKLGEMGSVRSIGPMIDLLEKKDIIETGVIQFAGYMFLCNDMDENTACALYHQLIRSLARIGPAAVVEMLDRLEMAPPEMRYTAALVVAESTQWPTNAQSVLLNTVKDKAEFQQVRAVCAWALLTRSREPDRMASFIRNVADSDEPRAGTSELARVLMDFESLRSKK